MSRGRIVLTIAGLALCVPMGCNKKSSSGNPSPAQQNASPSPTVGPFPAGSPPSSEASAAPTIAGTVVATATALPNFAPCRTQKPATAGSSPLPELDGTWRLKEVACIEGNITPLAQDTILKDISAGKQERLLTIQGSLGSRSIKKIPDPAAAGNHCLAKASLSLSFFPGEQVLLETRIDKSNWTAVGGAAGCTGEVTAESWTSAYCIPGDDANILMIIHNERGTPEKFCTAGQVKMIYVRQ